MPRQYQHIQMLLPQIREMLDSGKSQREIEKQLGLKGSRPIHQLLNRERKKSSCRNSKRTQSQAGKNLGGIQI